MSPTCPAPAGGEEFEQELRALVATKRRREFMMEPTSVAAVLDAPDVSAFRKVWLAIMAYTGLRPGEAHGPRVGDFRVESRVRYLRVDRQFKLARTKIRPQFGALKTKNAYRVVPVHPDLSRRLLWWIDQGWAEHVGRAPTAEDVLLPDEKGEAFREERADDFRELLAAVQLPTSYRGIPLTPYAVRHTFSSLAKRVGISEEDRDYFMGHTPKTTRARNYDVSDVRHLYVQIRKLPTFTATGLEDFRARMESIDGIDEGELVPLA